MAVMGERFQRLPFGFPSPIRLLDSSTGSVLLFPLGGISFGSVVDTPEVLDANPKVTPPSLT